ncbi:1,4-dihydroxy-2-naphthoate octaprenyltransferase [Anaerotaenia torta]|uniref:UbiA family prenyltransferase n=1 Tax=Anaerotaenia torta TaxID=433293 RepID=UPI003D1D5531
MINRFLSYVEIRTKITSLFAFLMSIALLAYWKQPVRWGVTALFFSAMFLFDLTTTAINNYIDTRSNRQQLQFGRKTALFLIYAMLGISAALGLYLAYLTDIVILLTGVLCFLCGVLYTYGPLPISRQPLGEVMSGIFYGLLIPFILFYINTAEGTFLTLNVNFKTISLELQVMPILSLLLFSVVPFCTTANIMLANNICDLEKDIAVKRHTLPYYIGRKALYLFAGLYYATYLATIGMVTIGVLSPVCLLSLATIVPVQKNINTFFRRQEKAVTFITSIYNYVIIMGINTVLIWISALMA